MQGSWWIFDVKEVNLFLFPLVISPYWKLKVLSFAWCLLEFLPEFPQISSDFPGKLLVGLPFKKAKNDQRHIFHPRVLILWSSYTASPERVRQLHSIMHFAPRFLHLDHLVQRISVPGRFLLVGAADAANVRLQANCFACDFGDKKHVEGTHQWELQGTVDGRNPANQLIDSFSLFIPLFTGFYTSLAVQDSFHQQYVGWSAYLMIQPAVECIQLRQGDERQKEDMGWGGFRGHEGTVSGNFGGCSLWAPIIEMRLRTYTLRISKVIDSLIIDNQ